MPIGPTVGVQPGRVAGDAEAVARGQAGVGRLRPGGAAVEREVDARDADARRERAGGVGRRRCTPPCRCCRSRRRPACSGGSASTASAGSFCLFCENGLGGLPTVTSASEPGAAPAITATLNASAAAIRSASSFLMNSPFLTEKRDAESTGTRCVARRSRRLRSRLRRRSGRGGAGRRVGSPANSASTLRRPGEYQRSLHVELRSPSPAQKESPLPEGISE